VRPADVSLNGSIGGEGTSSESEEEGHSRAGHVEIEAGEDFPKRHQVPIEGEEGRDQVVPPHPQTR